jgi:membrane protein implicated in regulation of membrane protease activity
MAPDVFDRETMLDLSVNVIPLFIILFFVVVFVAIAPFGYSLVTTTIQMALLIVPFIALAVLTYYSGKAISQSEAELEARENELAEGDAETSAVEGDDEDVPEAELEGTESAITEADTGSETTTDDDESTDE